MHSKCAGFYSKAIPLFHSLLPRVIYEMFLRFFASERVHYTRWRLLSPLHFALWFLSSKINRTIFSLKITCCKFLNVIIVFFNSLASAHLLAKYVQLYCASILFFFLLKDPVLTSRHCVRVLVVVFTRARQPLFLRSSAWKGIIVVHRCFLRVNFCENLWHGKVHLNFRIVSKKCCCCCKCLRVHYWRRQRSRG